MSQKVLSGHRVKIAVYSVATGKSQVLGIFNSVSVSAANGAQAVFILGRSSAAAIQFTHAEPINVRCTAWRAINHGPFATDGGVGMTLLQDMLKNEYTRLTMLDRQLENDGKDAVIGEVTDMLWTGFDSTKNIKSLVEYTVTGMGILYRDESGKNVEGPGATNLP